MFIRFRLSFIIPAPAFPNGPAGFIRTAPVFIIVAVVSVSLPDDLLARADAFLLERGLSGRSELVRAALRDFLGSQETPAREGNRSATLTLLYPHGYERRVGEVRHDYTDIVVSMMHGHVAGADDDLCVEVFVLQGQGRRIRAFADALRALRDTRLVQVVYTDAPREEGGAGKRRPAGHGHAHDR